MINWEFVVKGEFKNITRGQVWRLLMMMSKNWEIHPSHSKKHWTFSEVCKDTIADNEVICHAEAHWLSRGKKKKNVRACVSTVARVAGFPCSTRIPNIYLFKAILALFESEFCHGSCCRLHLRKLAWTFHMQLQQHRKQQDTTHVFKGVFNRG